MGWIILAVLLYGVLALGFRWGKQVGRGADRWETLLQARRNGGIIAMPEAMYMDEIAARGRGKRIADMDRFSDNPDLSLNGDRAVPVVDVPYDLSELDPCPGVTPTGACTRTVDHKGPCFGPEPVD